MDKRIKALKDEQTELIMEREKIRVRLGEIFDQLSVLLQSCDHDPKTNTFGAITCTRCGMYLGHRI